jgi:hypothetical protein
MEPIVSDKKLSDITIDYPEHASDCTISSFGTIAYLRHICNHCLDVMPCTCNSEKIYPYPGMLIRKQKDVEGNIHEYKSYLVSHQINNLVTWYKKRLQYDRIVSTNSNAHIPPYLAGPKRKTKGLWKYSNTPHIGKNFASKPYFDSQDNLYILAGYDEENHNTQIYECELSANNSCTWHSAYFLFLDTLYPFGYLSITPYLLQNLIKHIENGQCHVQREKEKTIFSSPDFFKQYLPEDGMIPLLQKIFNPIYITEITFKKHDDKKPPKPPIDIPLFDHYAGMAMCLNLTGNNKLARTCLEYFETEYAEKIDGITQYDPIRLGFFGKIYGPGCESNVSLYTDYSKILQSLTCLNSIDNVKKEYTNKTTLFVISPTCFIQAKKKNTKYTIYPWQNQHVWHSDWVRGSRYSFICSGTINNISIKKRSRDSVSGINELEITETPIYATEGCIKHSLVPNSIPPQVRELTKQYAKNSSDDWLNQLSLYDQMLLLKSYCECGNKTTDYGIEKNNIQEKIIQHYCPHMPTNIKYNANLLADDNLRHEELSQLYIGSHLKEIIKDTLSCVSYENHDYTQEEKNSKGLPPTPKTCKQLVSYLDKAKEWHDPSAKLRRAHPNYQKEPWYQYITTFFGKKIYKNDITFNIA